MQTPSTESVRRVFSNINFGARNAGSKEFAVAMDNLDPLRKFRSEFNLLPNKGIYFGSFGLGMPPKRTKDNLVEACHEWAQLGEQSYMHGKRPLRYYETRCEKYLQSIIGAHSATEICVMGACSLNMNLLFVSFFQPVFNFDTNVGRYKILIEGGAFCSDYHVIEGQLRLHQLTKDQALIEIFPDDTDDTDGKNSFYISNDKIIRAIESNHEEICVVWLGVSQYLSGQVFDIPRICSVAHRYGIYVGLDLSHGVGSAELHLHDWGVDFACWGSYKYLSGGGGAVGGIFVHERHHSNHSLKKMRGWWGQDLEWRYRMLPEYRPSVGARSWSISQAPLLSCVALESSLEIFAEAGMKNIILKSRALSQYCEYLIHNKLKQYISIVSPANIYERANQLSLIVTQTGIDIDELAVYLKSANILVSTRKPNVMRVGIAPLIIRFVDIWTFIHCLEQFFCIANNGNHAKQQPRCKL